ncbi:unnamed protein product [Moneuplotes crassus]|uniref:Peptidase C1A papain C-terminal domain-containing protein n=1 Tax=Euplotes crassus TaxID=5936 RepID=A0AAD1XH54_EUPCR|nr:unnamed protein product [Moneuplotes crassus]
MVLNSSKMWLVVVLALVMGSVTCFLNPINEEMVENIKEKAKSWAPMEVHENPLSSKNPFELIKTIGSKGIQEDISLENDDFDDDDIPESYNIKEQWPDCVIPVQNQEFCGADWALIGVGILSERYCIQSGGETKLNLSVESILACDDHDWGCSGGYPDRAWDHMTDSGILTEECFPFESKDGHRSQCPFQNKCVGTADAEYKKYYSTPFNFFSGEKSIQKELMANGPVQTEFQVYGDFLSYKSGIYQHVTGAKLGFYSAKIVGWGVEDDQKYWVAASVHGENWGENGYFRILRGTNECNFESSTMAGNPRES